MEHEVKGSAKFRKYCFTINNWTVTDLENARLLLKGSEYGIIGKEVGESGTPHLQGYARFKNPRTFNALRKAFLRAHIEPSKGNDEQNYAYCSKDKDFEEFGKMQLQENSEQGKRTDIVVIKEMINEGANMRDIIEVASSYQSIRMAEIILKYKEKKRNWKPKVEWFYGPTGTGKTRKAIEIFGENPYYISGKNLKWWEGYDGEENVVLDDFRADFCTFHELLRILDRYEFRIEVKGSSRQLLAKHIIITSCHHPREVYKKNEEDVGQLLRRIDNVEKLSTDILEQELGTGSRGVILEPPSFWDFGNDFENE